MFLRKIIYLLLGLILIGILSLIFSNDSIKYRLMTPFADNKIPLYSKNSFSKPVFDTTLYSNKNKLNETFFIPMTILYQGELLSGEKHNEIDVERLKKIAHNLPKSEIPYILDIEVWDVHTLNDTLANENIDKYILVIDTMKKERPDLKFGYYGVLPNRDYWSPITNNPKRLQDWNHINERLKRLSTHVDVVCPSLYTFYNDPEGWMKYALENIKRARIYGKPVYVFLWPQYHNNNLLIGERFLDNQFWEFELNIANTFADGIIVWGGWNLKKENYGPMQWDENISWWQITKTAIQNRN